MVFLAKNRCTEKILKLLRLYTKNIDLAENESDSVTDSEI